MPKRSLRTRSKKRSIRQVSGGAIRTYYKREKVGGQRCARCGRTLSGVPRLVPSEIRKLPASRRKIERPYGNLLCPLCLRETLRHVVRGS